MSKDLKSLIADRNDALRTLDLDYARRMLPGASSDFVRLMAMHKARYECCQIEQELRHASAAWLRSHGFNDMNGNPILPEGQLPQ
jgi:hypothetical protein